MLISKKNMHVKGIAEEDSDVVAERQRTKKMKSNDKNVAVKVHQMRKVFKVGLSKHKTAVEDISLTIAKGECFALLGVNGAGKTTTFKLLTGDINPTYGNAWIKGNKIPENMKSARKEIGYCPQNNVLLDRLTGREHLELFATIKGIPKKYR